jgi:hypothetical protein
LEGAQLATTDAKIFYGSFRSSPHDTASAAVYPRRR